MIKYARAQALRIIKGIVQNGSLVPTTHIREQMLRRNFDMQDVICSLQNGNIYREPEPHPKTGRWIYSIEGKTVDEVKIRIEVDISDDKEKVILITGIK